MLTKETHNRKKIDFNIDLSGYSILIADDEKSNFALAKHVLSETHINIDWAKNGQEAVAMTNLNTYDLILMDIRMPGMDGIEATRIIKRANSKIPVIMQTAFAITELNDEAQKAGCNDFIVKPIDLDNFLLLNKTYITKIPKIIE
jgi:CheY-like chemotaxis protein